MHRKLRVAIVGTNGIPANYGGFETLAENLVNHLSNEFHFIVYCSKKQVEKLKHYNNAKLINLPFDANGATGLIYDMLSLIHAWFFSDVILYLGPGIGTMLWINKIFKKKLITNHGGLNEWDREKLTFLQKKFAYFNHKYAAIFSDINIVDNFVLEKSLTKYFKTNSIVIRYGGDHVFKVNATPELIEKFPFLTSKYYVSVSRAQIDNNLHIVLEAFKMMPDKFLVLVSNWNSSEYGKELKKEYELISNIYLQDAVYDLTKLNCIRSNAFMYIHSHSQCGTAPSLVEAICLNLPIISFNVPQNQETLRRDKFFFNSSDDLKNILDHIQITDIDNLKKDSDDLKEYYNWQVIANQYAGLICK